jgi:hypothetical protein
VGLGGVVEHLPSEPEALSSKEKREREREDRRERRTRCKSGRVVIAHVLSTTVSSAPHAILIKGKIIRTRIYSL